MLARNAFLLIGRAGMDLMPHPPGTAIEEAVEYRVALGGSAANTAAGIARLGGAAALVTCVSDDAIGRYAVAQLGEYGVDATHVRAIGGEFRNSLAISESRLAGHQTVIYRNGAADFQMTEADIDAVDFSPYGGVVIAGTVFAAEPSRAAAFHALEKARAAGVPVIFDVDYRPYSWPSPEVAAEVLTRAGAASTAKLVVYKRGPSGAITITRDAEIETGIFPVDALKPTGAGDAFMAGLLTSLAEGMALREAVARGSACAAIVVGKPGCAPATPTRDELAAFMAANTMTG